MAMPDASIVEWIREKYTALVADLDARGRRRWAVGQLLRSEGYSLQANRKTVEGKQHPDRDAQFEHIAARVKAFQHTGQPAISIDTKKKESLGNMKNAGKTYRRKGDPTRVKTHDFPDKKLGKAIPYGIYDITYNEAGVSVPSFAVGHPGCKSWPPNILFGVRGNTWAAASLTTRCGFLTRFRWSTPPRLVRSFPETDPPSSVWDWTQL